MFTLITFFAALTCALANPTVHSHTNYGHLAHPTANFAPQPVQPFTNQVHQPFSSPVQPIAAPVQPMAGPVATPFTTTNSNRRGRWLADPITVDPAFKQVWSPSYSPSWSSWAPGSAWGTSGLYYSAPVTHKTVSWNEPAWKVDPTWKVDPVSWAKPTHYAGWAPEPVSAKWISDDKWSSGWASPMYGAHVASPWASPILKRSWAEVKPSPVGYYSAGFESKPWDVKPIVEKSLDDPSKPFSYSSHVVHA